MDPVHDLMETATNETLESLHPLADKWTLWAHLPHNTDWSIKSYISISTFTSLEDTIAVTETMPSVLVENCRKRIRPLQFGDYIL